MFKSFAIISLVTSAAFAQSASVPANISEGCSTFLNALNSDADLTTCLKSLSTSTSDYQQGSDATKTPSTAKIGSTLSKLCAPSVADACPEGLIRGKISDFYLACNAELTSNPNKDVVDIYDILYTISPLKSASCSKDDSGNYCVTQAKLPASSPSPDDIQKVLASPDLAPNTTTYSTYNIPFFLEGTLSSSDLCNVCTRNILTAYMNFEAKVPYAPGLGKSVLLAKQPALYQGIQNTCGSTFLSGAGVQAAGGLAGGSLSRSGAFQNNVGAGQGFMAAGLGAIALLASAL